MRHIVTIYRWELQRIFSNWRKTATLFLLPAVILTIALNIFPLLMNYLSTGSFVSRGLVADYNHVYEPALGVDVDDLGLDRKTWATVDVTEAQPYMEMGVATDHKLHCKRSGNVMSNLYAAGSVLSGHNSIKLLDGAGVDMLTALQVTENILNQ